MKFVKNNDVRVRVKYRQLCGYEVYYSKVTGSHTFQVKIVNEKHECGRVFDNSNAKARWVAKVIVDKLKSNSKISVDEIIVVMKNTYDIGIKTCTTIKARFLARKVVDGVVGLLLELIVSILKLSIEVFYW